jgi:hypothetical protein
VSAGLVRRVVRNFRSTRLHVVDAPAGAFGRYTLFGSEFTGITLPLTTACGALLRGSGHGVAVCMAPGATVTCARCVRLTGTGQAGADNTTMPEPAEITEAGQ